MASAGVAAVAGLDVLDVLPVVLGDGGSPGADGGEVGADLGVRLEAVGFVAGRVLGGARARGVEAPLIEDGCEGLGVGEGVVDAGLVAVGEVVGAAVEEAFVGAGGHQFEVAVAQTSRNLGSWSARRT